MRVIHELYVRHHHMLAPVHGSVPPFETTSKNRIGICNKPSITLHLNVFHMSYLLDYSFWIFFKIVSGRVQLDDPPIPGDKSKTMILSH